MSTPVIQVPSEIVEKWQEIVDLLAEIIHVPAALVMKVEPPNIKVFVSSKSNGNPYGQDEVASLNTGLYCDTVMKTRRPLLVPDALAEEEWQENPDLKLGMISYLGFPIAWPDGQIFGTICILDNKKNEYGELYRRLLLQCRDVLQTDLRWLAELGGELTTQKAHFDELFARVPEAIVLLDVDDRVVRVNGEFSRIFGYSPDEAVGRLLVDLIVPEELRGEAQEYIRRVTQQRETLNVEGLRRRKDGSRFPVSIVAVPVTVPGGQISAWMIYRDISERKRAHHVLRESEQRLRAIFEGAQIGIAIYDKDPKQLIVNPALQMMLDCGAEELNRLEKFDELTHPDDRVHDAALFRELLDERRDHYQQEKRYVIRDRRTIYANVHFSILRDAGGEARYALVLTEDITERKRLENELKYERDRLRLLLDITNSMVSRLDLRQLMEALSTNLVRVMHCDHCALFLHDTDSGQLRASMVYTPEGRCSTCEEMIVPLTGSVSGKVFRTAKSLRVDNFEDLRADPELFGNPEGQEIYEHVMAEGLGSGCFLPLLSRGRVLGVWSVCRYSEGAFADDDMVFLEQAARQVAIAVENALDYGKATEDRDKETEQKRYLQEEIRNEHNFDEIVGESRALKTVLEQVAVVAPTDSSVLILGETGTGKELIARAIHDSSARRERAFVKLNCAAIPLGLLESELFGHERGAFTGAIAQKTGGFELANKGTLFLDEVGDIPLELQAKLLRVLQEQEFERLGSNRTHKVDVRIIAATHRDLAKMVKQQTFREDLYYRLKVFPILVPALRERAEDIRELVLHFASRSARRMNKRIEVVPPDVMEALVRYRWPGNVRELQNFVERAVILSPASILRAPVAELESSSPLPQPSPATSALVQVEREHIVRALEESNWVVGGRNGAAARLGLKRTSLVYKMQKLGISRAPGEQV
jgi:formate hydrogenlyase transcriptional activator